MGNGRDERGEAAQGGEDIMDAALLVSGDVVYCFTRYCDLTSSTMMMIDEVCDAFLLAQCSISPPQSLTNTCPLNNTNLC